MRNSALRTTECAMPAAMSSTATPLFWAWRTREAMKTVHLVPKSTGDSAKRALSENSSGDDCSECAVPSTNDPHPLEQASFSTALSTRPSRTQTAFMSWPPISSRNVRSGLKLRAARTWASVSTTPESSPSPALSRFSPYPQAVAWAT